MNRFDEELNVTPVAARVVAGLCALAFVLIAWLGIFRDDPSAGAWPILAKIAFSGGIALVLASYVLLIGYVNGDARRRGMRYVMWTLLAVFIPNAIGIILYFVLRGPLLRDCPKCNTKARGGFAFCPTCGTPLRQACPNCKLAVEAGWQHCPRCGRTLAVI